jgi:hypothetical protein
MIEWSRTGGDTRRYHGGSILDTLLMSDFVVWSKTHKIDNFSGFSLKTRLEIRWERETLRAIIIKLSFR